MEEIQHTSVDEIVPPVRETHYFSIWAELIVILFAQLGKNYQCTCDQIGTSTTRSDYPPCALTYFPAFSDNSSFQVPNCFDDTSVHSCHQLLHPCPNHALSPSMSWWLINVNISVDCLTRYRNHSGSCVYSVSVILSQGKVKMQWFRSFTTQKNKWYFEHNVCKPTSRCDC